MILDQINLGESVEQEWCQFFFLQDENLYRHFFLKD